MKISRLIVQNYRNISYLDIEPSFSFNIIYGKNGSGKTSLLEAISYLGFGRSFRSAKFQNLIQYSQPSFTISSSVKTEGQEFSDSLGITRYRNRNEGMVISINHERSNRLADLVDKVSLQVIHPQGIDLLLDGPELRRNYIDWGIYYSEPSFKELWLNYKKVINQRNFLLKKKADSESIQMWDESLCNLSERITEYREKYFAKLKQILITKTKQFLPNFEFEFSFSKGWPNGLQLRSVLNLNIEKDRVLGYTFYGCHRADLKIKCNNLIASETLSRGQLKLLMCAMKLAQGNLLKEQNGKKCIFLIDDLSSELDSNSRQLLLQDLIDCDNQVFLTNISKDLEIPNTENTMYLDIEQSINTSGA